MRERNNTRRNNSEKEKQLTEDDVLVPVSGILDVLDNYAFIRTAGYLPSATDVYVSLSQVKRNGMRKGDAVIGSVKLPRDGEQPGRQKYNALVKVDSVNGQSIEEAQNRVEFASLTAIEPVQHLTLATEDSHPNIRAIDLFAPVALGQRGVIVAPNGGLTTVITQLAQAFLKNGAEPHVITLLIGARPEEVTMLSRKIDGTVIAASSDTPADEQSSLVELALERAKRMVELGHDVVLCVDNLSQIASVIESQLRRPGHAVVPGVTDSGVIATIKRFLSQARNLENAGSLAIYAGVRAGTELAYALQDVQNWCVHLEDIYLGDDTVSVNTLVSESRVAIDYAQYPQLEQVRKMRYSIAQKLVAEAEVFPGESELRKVLSSGGNAEVSALIGKLAK